MQKDHTNVPMPLSYRYIFYVKKISLKPVTTIFFPRLNFWGEILIYVWYNDMTIISFSVLGTAVKE